MRHLTTYKLFESINYDSIKPDIEDILLDVSEEPTVNVEIDYDPNFARDGLIIISSKWRYDIPFLLNIDMVEDIRRVSDYLISIGSNISDVSFRLETPSGTVNYSSFEDFDGSMKSTFDKIDSNPKDWNIRYFLPKVNRLIMRFKV